MTFLRKDRGLRTEPKKKSVIGLDDLYLLLYTHWALDENTYSDERQRVQVATGILAAAFFGCRPCSLFDTRVNVSVRTNSSDVVTSVEGETSHERHMEIEGQTTVRRGSSSRVRQARNRIGESEQESNNSAGEDSDSEPESLTCAIPEDSETDDDYGAGAEETRAFLYRHFSIIIVPGEIPGKPNVIFMKATLLHTKGEDNNPRM